MKKLLLLLLAAIICWMPCAVRAQMNANGGWHLPPPDQSSLWFSENHNTDTVFVFVHGFRGDNGATWAHQAGSGYDQFWPYLVWNDVRLRPDSGRGPRPSVFLGGYSSGPNYSLDDATAEFLGGLRDHGVITSYPNIIFVAHSLGGVVVRNMLVHSWSLFRHKHIGIALIASPTRGSQWADLIRKANSYTFNLKDIDNNQLLKTLQENNGLLDSVDMNFRNLVSGVDIDDPNRPRIVVGEAVEQYGPLLRSTELPPIVSKDSASPHLGLTRTIPDSDHMSIAKPADQFSPVHRFLVDFYGSFQQAFPSPVRSLDLIADNPLNPDKPSPLGNQSSQMQPDALPETGRDAPMRPRYVSPSSPDQEIASGLQEQIWGLTTRWGQSFSQGNFADLHNLYAPQLDTYFNHGSVSSEIPLESARKSVADYKVRQVHLSDPTFRSNASGEVEVAFCKSYHYVAYNTQEEQGAVRSYMRFHVLEGKWYITGLCDRGMCKGDMAAQSLLNSGDCRN